MPTRMLRDWTDSEKVNQLDWRGEVFFTRLIMKVDDFGRFPANPKLLKSILFPLKDGLRDADITRSMAACQKAGLIAVYKHEEKFFLEISAFNQRLRAAKSKYPERQENTDISVGCLTDVWQVSGKCRPESEAEEKRIGSEYTSSPPSAARDGRVGFDVFWNAYPNKKGKLAALRKWNQLKPPLDQCLSAISLQKASEQWRKDGGTFIPHPATWLNQGRWEDAPHVEVQKYRPGASKPVPPDPPGWREWLNENYPGSLAARTGTKYCDVSSEIKKQFNERNK